MNTLGWLSKEIKERNRQHTSWLGEAEPGAEPHLNKSFGLSVVKQSIFLQPLSPSYSILLLSVRIHDFLENKAKSRVSHFGLASAALAGPSRRFF